MTPPTVLYSTRAASYYHAMPINTFLVHSLLQSITKTDAAGNRDCPAQKEEHEGNCISGSFSFWLFPFYFFTKKLNGFSKILGKVNQVEYLNQCLN